MTIHMPTTEEIEAYERLEANRWTCACGYSSLADPCSGCGAPRHTWTLPGGGTVYSRDDTETLLDAIAELDDARREIAEELRGRGVKAPIAVVAPWPPPADADRVMGYDPTAMMGPRWSDLGRGPGWHTWRGYTHWLPWLGNPDTGEKLEGGGA